MRLGIWASEKGLCPRSIHSQDSTLKFVYIASECPFEDTSGLQCSLTFILLLIVITINPGRPHAHNTIFLHLNIDLNVFCL